MKIAIVCQTEKAHDPLRLGGGIMAVERMQAQLLAEAGTEVHVLTVGDSDPTAFYPGLTVHKLPSLSEEAFEASRALTKHEKGTANKQRGAELEEILRELHPDVIINHSFSSSHVKLMARLAAFIPVLNFIHNCVETASDMSIFAKVQAYQELTRLGSRVVCVTKHQRNTWRVRLRSRKTGFGFLDLDQLDEIFSWTCAPGYALPSGGVKAPEEKLVVIGRPEPDKDIGRLLEVLKLGGLSIKLQVFLAFGGDLESYDYYVTRMKPYLTDRVEVLCNRPRTELLEQLSTALLHVVTCPVESASLAALEAASLGVTSLLFSKGDPLSHAAESLTGSGIKLATGRPKALIEPLTQALARPDLRSLDARNHVRETALNNCSREALKVTLLGLCKRVQTEARINQRAPLLEF